MSFTILQMLSYLCDLRKNKHELIEIRNVLTKSEEFWQMNQLELPEGGIENPSYDEGEEAAEESSMKLANVCGVLERSKLVTFEKMLWRVSKGNIFVRF